MHQLPVFLEELYLWDLNDTLVADPLLPCAWGREGKAVPPNVNLVMMEGAQWRALKFGHAGFSEDQRENLVFLSTSELAEDLQGRRRFGSPAVYLNAFIGHYLLHKPSGIMIQTLILIWNMID